MKKLLIFTVIVSLVTLGGFFGGKKVCMMMWPGSVNPSQAWYFELGLNPPQAEALKKLETSFRGRTDKLCMKICEERLKLLNQMRQGHVDREIIYKKIEEIGALQVSLEKEIATHILNVKDDLTPTQSQAYLDRIHEQFRDSLKKSGYDEILKQ
jgi:hypothetical protein